jgi:hypothetical protein
MEKYIDSSEDDILAMLLAEPASEIQHRLDARVNSWQECVLNYLFAVRTEAANISDVLFLRIDKHASIIVELANTPGGEVSISISERVVEEFCKLRESYLKYLSSVDENRFI